MWLLKWLLTFFFDNKKPSAVVPEDTRIYKFIAKWEGFRATPYVCDGGVLTIGYGRTENVSPGDVTTEDAEWDYLCNKCKCIRKEVLGTLASTNYYSTNQLDAMVSFVYNFGITKFTSSTLLTKIRSGDEEGIKVQWMRWVYAKRKYIKGLYRRRKAELKLYLTGDYSL